MDEPWWKPWGSLEAAIESKAGASPDWPQPKPPPYPADDEDDTTPPEEDA